MAKLSVRKYWLFLAPLCAGHCPAERRRTRLRSNAWRAVTVITLRQKPSITLTPWSTSIIGLLVFSRPVDSPTDAISDCLNVDRVRKRFVIFSERTTLRSLYAIGRPPVCCLSVVCDVGAPYSGGWTFRQFFSPYDSPGTLLFWCQKSLVGDAAFPLKFAFKVTHPSLKQRNFDKYRLIAPQPWYLAKKVQ